MTVSGRTLNDLIDALEEAYPGVKQRLCGSGKLRAGVVVIVDGRVTQLDSVQHVDEHSEVSFLPAVSGG